MVDKDSIKTKKNFFQEALKIFFLDSEKYDGKLFLSGMKLFMQYFNSK